MAFCFGNATNTISIGLNGKRFGLSQKVETRPSMLLWNFVLLENFYCAVIDTPFIFTKWCIKSGEVWKVDVSHAIHTWFSVFVSDT